MTAETCVVGLPREDFVCEEPRFGETRTEDLLSGDCPVWLFRAGLIVTGVEERTELFFLIDNGSTLLTGGGLFVEEGFGVVSVLPVGTNGWRLLRGSGDVSLSRLGVVVEVCVVGGNGGSKDRSPANEGISLISSLHGLLLGDGDGHRGPKGRLEERTELE
jgi:hypothetical protein